MKQLLIAFLLFVAIGVNAQSVQMLDMTTPHTNNASTHAFITIPGVCTNAPYTTTNYIYIVYGDAPPLAWSKVNSDLAYFTNIVFKGASVAVTNVLTGAQGTPVLVTNLGTSVAGVFQFTFPASPTNAVLSSQQIVTYSTNYAYWASSNFLGTVNGLYNWKINGGDDGGAGPDGLPGQIPVSLVGSYTGTNAWFAITNGFQTTNLIAVALITNGLSQFGGHLVNPGQAILYSVDHFELLGRTNSFFGQHYQFDTPILPADAATKAYVDGSIANFEADFPSYMDTNYVLHTVYTVAGQSIFDTPQAQNFAPLLVTGLDSTGTNFLISVMETNLVNGFTVLANTNLALSYNWTAFTNYTTNIASGTNTFTIPINFGYTAQFFRILKSGGTSIGFTAFPTITANSGTIYPSNTWNLATITNGMPNFSFWEGNSNGLAQVSLYLSNGVPWIKRLAP